MCGGLNKFVYILVYIYWNFMKMGSGKLVKNLAALGCGCHEAGDEDDYGEHEQAVKHVYQVGE